MKKPTLSTLVLGCVLAGSAFVADISLNTGLLIKDANARVGRPLTPVSYAGVARRTTRRAIVRTSVYVAALPRGCTTVIMEGATLHQCGTTYYQPYGSQYVVVNIQ